MDDRIFVLDLLLVKLESAACNIGPTKNSSKVNDTFSGLTNYKFYIWTFLIQAVCRPIISGLGV